MADRQSKVDRLRDSRVGGMCWSETNNKRKAKVTSSTMIPFYDSTIL